MKYAAMVSPPCASDCGLDAVEELPPGVERVLQRVAHARLGRGVGRMTDDDAVAYLAVVRIGHLVDIPEGDRVAAQPVVLLEPAGHRPERAGDLSLRRQVHRGRRFDERALLGRQLEPVDQRTRGGKRAPLHHLRARETNGLAEADEDLRVGLVAAGDPPRLLLVDALRERDALLGEWTVGVHGAHGAGKLTHLQEELDCEHLQLFAAQLAVGELEPERVTTEGAAGPDACGQIADEVLGGQNFGYRILLAPAVTELALRSASESMPSVRPGRPIPGAVERPHSPTDREELALRIHLAGDAMAQLIEERALETVGEEHAGVSQNERRSLGELAPQLPRPVEEPVPRKHLVDGSPFERLLGRELLPRQEEVSSSVASDDRRPDHVLAVARHHAARKKRQVREVGGL